MPLRDFDFADMERKDSISSSSGSSDEGYVKYDQEDEWVDAEPDAEELDFISLFDDKKFPSLKSLVDYSKEKHDFDFLEVSNRLGRFPTATRRQNADGLQVWTFMAASSS